MGNGERSTHGEDRKASGLRPGDHIGPYRVEEPLGRGGMGEVVVAYDRRLDRRVAIKRIRHDIASANRDAIAADRERLRREARAAAGLNHPAIVQVYDILSEGEDDAIVMELVEGCPVAKRLEDGPLPLPEALRIARQVAEGLAEAHRVGLVHRDLKAENVMLTPPTVNHPGRAKILDFGLAKQLSRDEIDQTLTRQGTVLGTARAMSPEQAEGGEIDHRCDLFSLGVLLYEMLTGQSPFLGANAVETFRRLLVETPRPIGELRPEVPAKLERLVVRLLEKRPEQRIGDAGAVARELADLAPGALAEAAVAMPADFDSLNDVPTGSFVGLKSSATTQDLPPAASDEKSAKEPISVLGRLAAVAVSIMLAVLVGVFLRGESPQPLRVVVLRPEVGTEEPAEELELVASGARVAALAVLAELDGVAPVEPSETRQTSGTPQEVALAVAADEALAISVERREADAGIFLRRIRGADGEVRWANSIVVPLRVERARLVAEAMKVQLQRAYPRSSPRGAPRLQAQDADFAKFVQVTQRIDSGQAPLEPELLRLQTIIEGSPRFLTALLRASQVALTLHSDTRDASYLERAESWIQQARGLAPEDSKALQLELRTALARGETEAAEAVLAELEELVPNSAEVLLGRYRLAKKTGDLQAAEGAMEQFVERRPSWGNLYRLADLKYRRGEVAGARAHLDELIRRAPRNTWGLGKLAQLELLYGDLERAERLAMRAIGIHPHRSYFTNLGLARFFLGDYRGARESYLRALAVEPGHLAARLNLADAELAMGLEEQALVGYRRILEDLEGQGLEAGESMIAAQCLARLGEEQQAVAITLKALQEHPDDAAVAFQAALVYALIGEAASALVNVERALSRGFQTRWFELPDFDRLRSDPRFRNLVARELRP